MKNRIGQGCVQILHTIDFSLKYLVVFDTDFCVPLAVYDEHRIFPDCTNALAEKARDDQFLIALAKEYEEVQAAYESNREIMRYRVTTYISVLARMRKLFCSGFRRIYYQSGERLSKRHVLLWARSITFGEVRAWNWAGMSDGDR